jgi:hypothetical protein
MFAWTFKTAPLMHAAVPDIHTLHSTITEKLQKWADLRGGLTTKWRLNTACIIPLVLSTEGIITDRLQGSLKLRDLRPALYIITQKAVIFSACRIVRQFLAEQ